MPGLVPFAGIRRRTARLPGLRRTLAPVYSGDLPIGPQTIAWSPTGLKDGKYAAVLTATNEVGTVVHIVLFHLSYGDAVVASASSPNTETL